MLCECEDPHFSARRSASKTGTLSRRSLILGGGAFCLLTSALTVAATNGQRIDVHHHFLPPEYLKAAPASADVQRAVGWTPEKTLTEMDENGVAIAMLSFPTPEFWYEGQEPGRRLARLCNDYCADLMRRHPRRFGLFAGVPPLPDTDGVLQEITYAYDTLKADGVTVMTSYDGRYLGDASFTPVWAELNRRAAVIFVHPAVPACCSAVSDGAPNPAYAEFPFDTARTVLSLWIAEAATKWPRIRFIFSHGGGALPMIADRIDQFGRPAGSGAPLVHDGAAFFRMLYFDTANAASPPALSATRALASPQHVLFGTDYPFIPTRRILDGFALAAMSTSERRAIERDNALTLFPQLRARLV